MRTIKFQIVGKGADTDAPTVDDVLDQLRSFIDILKGVERATAEGGAVEIEWRIVDASKASPLTIEVAPFPRQFATNIDRRAENVIAATANGFRQLQTGDAQPHYFNKNALEKAEKIFSRITDGLAETIVDYGPDLPVTTLNRANASAAATHVREIIKPPLKEYKELGSVEGIAHVFYKDKGGNPALKIKLRLTGDDIECRLAEQALKEVEARRIGDIWKTCRVQLYGMIQYKSLGHISRMEAHMIRFLRSRAELPDIEEIHDENFTGGLKSEDYLERLRNGDIS